jgi:hypothetical protein
LHTCKINRLKPDLSHSTLVAFLDSNRLANSPWTNMWGLWMIARRPIWKRACLNLYILILFTNLLMIIKQSSFDIAISILHCNPGNYVGSYTWYITLYTLVIMLVHIHDIYILYIKHVNYFLKFIGHLS